MSGIQSLRLRDRIADRLREEIVCGKLTEGAPLRELPLAERFEVSRGPVRDAILQLVSEGLVEDRPNRGARVGRVWDATIRPAMVKIRRDIETLALRELMSQKQELDLSPFRDNLRHFELACRDEDLSAVIRLDMSFHRLILSLSGHPGAGISVVAIDGRHATALLPPQVAHGKSCRTSTDSGGDSDWPTAVGNGRTESKYPIVHGY